MTDLGDIEQLIPLEIPQGGLGASTVTASGYVLLMTRDEAQAILRASQRWRKCNQMLGRAAVRSTSNDRIVRECVEVAVENNNGGDTMVQIKFRGRA
jgi:hypothetical protein